MPKYVLGTEVPSLPPAPEDGPPLVPPRRRASAPESVDESSPELAPRASRVAPERSLSPPGGIKIAGPGGWSISLPQVALVAILTAAGTWFGSKAVTEKSDSAEVASELRLLRKEMAELKDDVRAVRAEQVDGRTADKAIVSYVTGTVTPIVASLRKCCGVKLEFERGDPFIVEFHEPPHVGSGAPSTQPKAVLPSKPNL